MLKRTLLLIISLLTASMANAQMKPYNPLKDTIVYMLKYPNQMVYKKEEADYYRIVMPPKDDQKLYSIEEVYPDGKIKLSGISINPNIYLKYQGPRFEFYPNSNKKTIENFDNGKRGGNAFYFYPNGKLYESVKYNPGEKILLDKYADSTGKVLAENGNGYWVKYNEDFTRIIGEGNVKDSLEDGEWHGNISDTLKYSCVYSKGVVVSGQDPEQLLDSKIFSAVDTEPSFKGGIEAFYGFLGRVIRYPDNARIHKIHGKEFVTFIVEKDGTLSNFRITRGVDKDLDAEALRVLKLSPPWIPGSQNGRPVRVQYTMPINFAIQTDDN